MKVYRFFILTVLVIYCGITLAQSNFINELNFGTSEDIDKAQLFDNHNGYFANRNKKFFRITNGVVSPIIIDSILVVTNFHFKNEKEGIVTCRVKKENAHKLIFHQRNENELNYNLYFQGVYSGHHLLNSEFTDLQLIAETKDSGKTWTYNELKTNFQVSDCIFFKNDYYISTKGPAYHLDGDVWKFEPEKNNFLSLYMARRSINGLDTLNNNIVVYGSHGFTKFYTFYLNQIFWLKKRKKEFQDTENQKSRNRIPGELLIFNDSIDYIKLHDFEKEILKLSIDKQKGIWFTDSSNTLKYFTDNRLIVKKTFNQPIKQIKMISSTKGFILLNDGIVEYYNEQGKTNREINFSNKTINFIDIVDDVLYLFGDKGFVSTLDLKTLYNF